MTILNEPHSPIPFSRTERAELHEMPIDG